MDHRRMRTLTRNFAAGCVLVCGGRLLSQVAVPPSGGAVPVESTAGSATTVADEVRELRAIVEDMREENRISRAEMKQLRGELQSTRALLERVAGIHDAATPETVVPAPLPLEMRVEKLEESGALLGAKVDEQYQTKVETASKYRARLSGIVLMNAFRNHGISNNFDYPDFAVAAPGLPQSGFGTTLRQSEIALEIFGPNLAGAKASANIHLDFGGGLPSTANGVNFGIVRLKTASLRLDWENTSFVAGQDALFISPQSPTSFASLATPAFAYAGNLWGWIPQIRVEHRFEFSNRQRVTLQAGIMDNLTWDFPANSFYRSAQAGEQSGQPAYAVRTAWSRPVQDREIVFGAAGYYGRQNWGSGRSVDGWAGMADWQVPLMRRLTLSGEFYRGRGVGGLGAGIGRSVLYGGLPYLTTTSIRGVDSAGGWSQLKVQVTPRVEMNGVFAQDDAFSSDVRGFASDLNNGGTILGRNRGGSGNVIFRPRSDLTFSAEIRRLRSFPIYSSSRVTNQLNLAMGILF